MTTILRSKIIRTEFLNEFSFILLSFLGVSGATIKLDKYGDSEGNFSVLALKKEPLYRDNFTCEYQMAPVGQFQQGEILVSELFVAFEKHFSQQIENSTDYFAFNLIILDHKS